MACDRITLTASGRVAACPDCDTGGSVFHRPPDADSLYRCNNCQARFDEYVERDAYDRGGNPLRDVDPEEVLGA